MHFRLAILSLSFFVLSMLHCTAAAPAPPPEGGNSRPSTPEDKYAALYALRPPEMPGLGNIYKAPKGLLSGKPHLTVPPHNENDMVIFIGEDEGDEKRPILALMQSRITVEPNLDIFNSLRGTSKIKSVHTGNYFYPPTGWEKGDSLSQCLNADSLLDKIKKSTDDTRPLNNILYDKNGEVIARARSAPRNRGRGRPSPAPPA